MYTYSTCSATCSGASSIIHVQQVASVVHIVLLVLPGPVLLQTRPFVLPAVLSPAVLAITHPVVLPVVLPVVQLVTVLPARVVSTMYYYDLHACLFITSFFDNTYMFIHTYSTAVECHCKRTRKREGESSSNQKRHRRPKEEEQS